MGGTGELLLPDHLFNNQSVTTTVIYSGADLLFGAAEYRRDPDTKSLIVDSFNKTGEGIIEATLLDIESLPGSEHPSEISDIETWVAQAIANHLPSVLERLEDDGAVNAVLVEAGSKWGHQPSKALAKMLRENGYNILNFFGEDFNPSEYKSRKRIQKSPVVIDRI